MDLSNFCWPVNDMGKDKSQRHKSTQSPGGRLESWKEIAAYFGRDVRTVQRWEKTEGLPVHQGTVYALETEIREWWESRDTHDRRPHDARLKPRPGRLEYLTGGLVLLLVVAAFFAVPRFQPNDHTRTTANGKTIAVLPFVNLGSVEHDYFADGVTEKITVKLAGLAGLSVIARTSVLEYKGTQKSITKIGEELGADYLLEGSVRWQPSSEGSRRVRVSLQLLRVADEMHVWADVYDEPLTEVFNAQSNIATHVAQQLEFTLLESDR